ncbi:MAG: hypothetical protein A2Y80_07890 [Deltaproteobacteria bacterium RBG_13_58_19]|nr:MAG: hypothetical protein A2Y80_07890 [Deltaproteobacteria bacterium RBG_13_58_19]
MKLPKKDLRAFPFFMGTLNKTNMIEITTCYNSCGVGNLHIMNEFPECFPAFINYRQTININLVFFKAFP